MAILISQAAAIRKEDMDQLGPVKTPLSSPPALLVGRRYLNEIPGIDSMGIWECSPGRWRRTIMEEEFAHFIKGSARFIPEDGDPIDIRAGDTIWFPANSRGVWEINEDVRKVYVIIDRPGFFERLKSTYKKIRSFLGLGISRLSAENLPTGATPVSDAVAAGRRDHGFARARVGARNFP